jgi:hypothetical protein
MLVDLQGKGICFPYKPDVLSIQFFSEGAILKKVGKYL